MATKPTTIDEYLAGVSAAAPRALEKLRKTIKSAAPKAEEYISYGLAAFKLDGRPLVAFGATANHCAFFPMDNTTVAAFNAELKGYDTSKGTIRFQPESSLPSALVRKLVKARMAAMLESRLQPVIRRPAKASAPARPPKGGTPTRTDPAVVAFLDKLDHPLKKEIKAVRQIIFGVSPEIREGIKWNSPSFRTTEWFATLNLRDGRVWLILHTGAKAKKNANMEFQIADPTRLLKWLAKDRCVVTFENGKDVKAKQAALEAVVREWIGRM